jgi:hypothetical protein
MNEQEGSAGVWIAFDATPVDTPENPVSAHYWTKRNITVWPDELQARRHAMEHHQRVEEVAWGQVISS